MGRSQRKVDLEGEKERAREWARDRERGYSCPLVHFPNASNIPGLARSVTPCWSVHGLQSSAFRSQHLLPARLFLARSGMRSTIQTLHMESSSLSQVFHLHLFFSWMKETEIDEGHFLLISDAVIIPSSSFFFFILSPSIFFLPSYFLLPRFFPYFAFYGSFTFCFVSPIGTHLFLYARCLHRNSRTDFVQRGMNMTYLFWLLCIFLLVARFSSQMWNLNKYYLVYCFIV